MIGTAATSPYRGLIPFSEDDAPLFFGRERESVLICDSLLAHRTTVLYGPSGVGKSSLLRADVVPRLRRMAAGSGAPDFAVVLNSGWHHDPVEALSRAAVDAVSDLGRQPVEAGDLPGTLERCAEAVEGDLLIILDQFEEFFTYHHPGSEHEFAAQLAHAARSDDLPVSFLLSIRQDSLWRLDELKGVLPSIFQHVLRLDALDEGGARQAIVGPLEAYGRLTQSDRHIGIEPALVEALLDQLALGVVPINSADRLHDGRELEASVLQLVLSRLWECETAAGSTMLRLETLDALGGAVEIARSYLDDALAPLSDREQELAAAALRYLVTPSGVKIAYTAEDLASYAVVPVDELRPVLERMAALRVLRPVAPGSEGTARLRWELMHDLLAAAALDWRARRAARAEADRALGQAHADARLRRRLNLALAAIAGLLVVVLLLAALLLA